MENNYIEGGKISEKLETTESTELNKTSQSTINTKYKNSLLPDSKNMASKSEEDHIDLLVQENAILKKRIRIIERRLHNIEKSNFWKIKKLYTKVKFVFKSSTSSQRGNGFLRYLKFFLSQYFYRVCRKLFKYIFKYLYLFFEDKPVRIVLLDEYKSLGTKLNMDPYQIWLEKNSPRESDLDNYADNIKLFHYHPFFSIIVPVYNPPEKYLREMLDSVRAQIYNNWELCISDDASPNAKVRNIIQEYAKKDSRIKYIFRKENGHISANSNSALSIASGEFAVLLDHDDLLTADALYQVAYTLNQQPETDFIYSDEDKIDEYNRFKDAYFKPDWSPDSFLSRNYVCHLSILRMSILKDIGGFREGFEGSQDYDLFLRYTERTNRIVHIPKILYHWRSHRDSAAMNTEAKPYAYIAAQKALEEALARRGEPGKVYHSGSPGNYTIRYEIIGNPKVSIIIPNKNKADILSACLLSIFEKSTYTNFEIIVIDNASTDEDIFELYAKMKEKYPGIFQQVSLNIPFNFSSLINFGRSKATGDFILLLNNDTEVITPDWLEGMIEHAQRETIGVVGCKLLYGDDTIQHAGVLIGLKGTAGHAFVSKNKDDDIYFNYINCTNNYSALTGACIMIKTELFDLVDGLDEEFSTEFNDIDFCLRIREHGYHNIYLPHVELYHHESLSRGYVFATKKSSENHEHEKELFNAKWHQYIKQDPCYSIHLSLNDADFRVKT